MILQNRANILYTLRSLRPVIVESYEEPDELDGYPEKNLPKKHPEFLKAREVRIITKAIVLE